MKRIVSFTLSLLIMFQILPVSAQILQDEKVEKPGDYKFAVDFVKSLKLMSGYPGGDFKPEETITRSEFSVTAVKMMGFENKLENVGVDTKYRDVTSAHWASPYINYSTKMGIMSGYSDGLFYPENNITYEEVAKTVMCILGYGHIAELNGGYPDGYMKEAMKAKLFNNITFNKKEFATRGNVAQIIYNAKDIDIMGIKAIENSQQFVIKTGVNFLNEYFKIYEKEGIVTSCNNIKINGEFSIKNDEIEIDNMVLKKGDCDCTNLIGQNVTYFYEKPHGNNKGILRYIVPSDNNIEKIEGDNIIVIENGVVKYYNDNYDEKSIRINMNANVLYNGKFMGKAINLDKINRINGELIAIDVNGDRKFDNIILKDFKYFIVNSVNTIDSTINLKLHQNPIMLQDASYSIYKGDEGISLDEIITDDVLQVALSDNFYIDDGEKKMAEIRVLSDICAGKVNSCDGCEIEIVKTGGKEQENKRFEISKSFVSEEISFDGENALNFIGKEGTFYIDTFGKVASFMEKSNTGEKFGYVINAYCNKFKNEAYLKILTTAASVEELKIGDSVKVDGKKETTMSAYNTVLRNSTKSDSVKLMIKYKVNKDNLINYIDTLEIDATDNKNQLKLTELSKDGGLRYQAQGCALITSGIERYIIDEKTIVFIVPTSKNVSDDDYSVYGSTYFKNEEFYGDSKKGDKLSFYNLEDGVPEVVCIEVEENEANLDGFDMTYAPLCVVQNMSNCIDEDGEEIVKLDVMKNKKTESLKISNKCVVFNYSSDGNTDTKKSNGEKITINDIEFGDCILCNTNSKGKVISLVKLNPSPVYKMNANDKTYSVSGLNSYVEIVMGSVRKKKNTVLSIDVSDNNSEVLINSIKGAPVYIVNNKTEKVDLTSFSDIIASDNDIEADKVLVKVRFGWVREIVIYR